MAETSDVIICGGGPVGLGLSIELARHGLRSTVFERNPTTSTHPKARNINTRSMEIVRRWGEDARRSMRSLNLPRAWVEQMVYTSTLSGAEHGRMLTAGFAGPGPEVSPECPILTAQDAFEPILVDIARRTGLVTLRFGHEVTGLDQRDDHVEAKVLEAGGAASTVRAPYLVAADGAGSPTRERLGIPTEGRRDIGHFVNVHYDADLSRWVDHRPAVIYWVANDRHRGVFQPLDGRRRWLSQIPFGGTDSERARVDPAWCSNWIREAVGGSVPELEILSFNYWTMHATVSKHFRRGRVFLAGDAAHQMPPTGGFGMNTGLQDIDNLAWKLALVLRGVASPSLLDTYEVERKPVAVENTARSLDNSRLVGGVSAAATGNHASGLSPADAVRAAVRYGNFAGLELGYSYGGPAIVPDGTAAPEPGDPVIDYVPTGRPGHRFPHLWLTDGRSSLDLVGTGFVLVTLDPDAWRGYVDDLGSPLLAHAPISPRDPDQARDVLGITGSGALLVRPDGHIAARWAEPPGRPARALARSLALAALL